MKSTSDTFCTVVGYLALALLAGCGPAGPDVQMVEGIVTLDGAPLAGATVAFTPADKNGIPAAGITDADGRFRLNATQGSKFGKGTVVGEYVVTIKKMELPEGAAEPVYVTPRVYENTVKSPLKATIVKGRNAFEFSLSANAR